jgi:6-phosphogluconate dehydrogenase
MTTFVNLTPHALTIHGEGVTLSLPASGTVARCATVSERVATLNGIPVPAFSASLGYYDSYRAARLPANLLQAQRDFFGAHTYERTDKPGTFHSEWLDLRRPVG